MAFLQIMAPDGSERAVQTFEVTAASATIGRSPDCHVCIEDPSVSRHHARMDYRDGMWSMTELSPTNGIVVGGTRITSVMLRPGVKVQLGNVILRFAVEDPREDSTVGLQAMPGHATRPPGPQALAHVATQRVGPPNENPAEVADTLDRNAEEWKQRLTAAAAAQGKVLDQMPPVGAAAPRAPTPAPVPGPTPTPAPAAPAPAAPAPAAPASTPARGLRNPGSGEVAPPAQPRGWGPAPGHRKVEPLDPTPMPGSIQTRPPPGPTPASTGPSTTEAVGIAIAVAMVVAGLGVTVVLFWDEITAMLGG